jgi:protein tyrosine/serine phosphatase
MLQIGLKRAFTTAVIILLASAATAARADESAYPELPNFHKVDERLSRGGQPTAGGIARLKELGVRTIVNLRHEPKRVKAEEKEALEAGLRYFSVPMHGLSRPTSEQVTRVFALFDEEENWPVFVHCKAGADRTGVMVALYRVARAGWTAERAIREALDKGMMKIEWAKRAFVREYYAGLQSTGGTMAADAVAGPASATPQSGDQ